MKLITEQPWYFIFLCLILALSYAWLLYKNDKKNESFGNTILYLLASLRFISSFILALLLLNFLLKRTVQEIEKPSLIFAFDNSASIIQTKDSLEIKNEFLKAYEALKTELSEKYTIQSLVFGSSVNPDKAIDFKDKETDFSQLLHSIQTNYSNQNTGALVICSDGIINRGNTYLNQIDKFDFPIYTIALGDSSVKKDLAIQKVNHNQVVYLGNKFPVEIIISSFKCKGSVSKVSISKNGINKAEQTVSIQSDNTIQSFNFVLDAERPGLQKYSVKVSSLEGEYNTSNNLTDFVIDVIDTRDKVLILANAPHPDVAAIKESLESTQTYEVESALISEFNKPLKPYSLIIFHSVSFTHLNLLNELKTNHQSYLIINPLINEQLPGLKITSSYHKQNEVEPILNKNFTLFNISDELKKFIQDFPAINANFGSYLQSPAASSLLYQKIGMVETENPILMFNESNGIKSAVFTGDGLWRWRMRDYSEHSNQNLFNELISKTTQYLSVKADKSFFRLTTKKIISENDLVEFNAEVYNKSYQLITEPDVTLILTDTLGKNYNYTMSKNSSNYYLNGGLFPPGEYTYKATTKVDQDVYTKSGTISIKRILAEQINTIANHTLLHQLSEQTGGKLVYKNQLADLKKDLQENEFIKTVTYTQKQLNDLIDLKWIFFLIIGLLGLEWFLRKRSGAI